MCLIISKYKLRSISKLLTSHSELTRNLIKLKGTAKLTAQGEQVCLKDSKYTLFEILANRTWKGRISSCRPSQPNCQIWLVWLAGASIALPCLIWQVPSMSFANSLDSAWPHCEFLPCLSMAMASIFCLFVIVRIKV